jgi:hypothetical protein
MIHSADSRGGAKAGQACLRSWKEIATYAQVSVATVQRWEKCERLPVHRHMHRRIGSVYAYPSEIDEWLRGRDPYRELGLVGAT